MALPQNLGSNRRYPERIRGRCVALHDSVEGFVVVAPFLNFDKGFDLLVCIARYLELVICKLDKHVGDERIEKRHRAMPSALAYRSAGARRRFSCASTFRVCCSSVASTRAGRSAIALHCS